MTGEGSKKAKKLASEDVDALDRMLKRVSTIKKATEKKLVPLLFEKIALFVEELAAK
jgi:hypothetical protein